MAVRKVYTNGELELEIKWSDEGIHLFISHQTHELPPFEFTIETSDVNEFLEDIDIFTTAIEESITKSEN